MRLASLVSSAAALETAAPSRPETTSWSCALAIVLHEEEADVRDIGQIAADLLLDSALRKLALIFRNEVDDEGRLAHLVAAAEQRAADDEGALHVRAGADATRDLFGDGLRIDQARARRQLDAEQRAAAVLGRHESIRNEIGARDGETQDHEAEDHALDAVAHGPGDEARIGAQDRRLHGRPSRACA